MTPNKIALVGNPNCGKSTLFNALTGSKQRIGNWPGVTVEKKSGYFSETDHHFEVIDLPGLYQLSLGENDVAIDEQIATNVILSNEFDVMVNVIDINNLERSLYFTTQLLELDLPIIIVLNMIDVAEKEGKKIDIQTLQQTLGCPVMTVSASKKIGIDRLKQTIVSQSDNPNIPSACVHYPEKLQASLKELHSNTLWNKKPSQAYLLHLLESEQITLNNDIKSVLNHYQKLLTESLNDDLDIIIAGCRYQFAHELVRKVLQVTRKKHRSITHYLDQFILNRFLGIPVFLAVMYALFFFAINIGGAFQDFFDITTNTLFVQGLGHWLNQIGTPIWLTAVIASGIGKGINTTITFVPVIAAMYFFLAFLENSGYMARAAFVMDRFMRFLGLPGKSFVPMIVGFGCNVPAIMATRTIEHKKDRILTVLMSPFMSCGARLAIFAVFTAAFFPQGGQNIVFALYLLGIGMAVLTGLLLRKTILQGELSPLIMELPSYHLPTMRALLQQTWHRLKNFLIRAGKLIIPICMLIGALNAVNTDGTFNHEEGSQQSVLSAVGKSVTPVFAPMGIQQDNWPATVGLVTGVLAKEVVVATLNTLYSQKSDIKAAASDSFNFKDNIKSAFQSIPNNLKSLRSSFENPILASAPAHDMSQAALGEMYIRFNSQSAAFAYLVFILLYIPCVSTIAAIARELNRRWTIFSVLWNTGVAYGTAVFVYQLATWTLHPLSSFIWLIIIVSLFLLTIFILKYQKKDNILLNNREVKSCYSPN